MIYQPKILRALLVSSFVITLIVAVVTLFIQISFIEDKVISLAKNEVKYFVKSLQQDMELDENHFLKITIFDNKDRVISSKEVPNFKRIREELAQYKHNIVTKSTNKEVYTLLHNQIKNRFYFEFKTYVTSNKFNGYVQGLYKISNNEVEKIYLNILYSIVQIVVAIFITTILLYPIIVYLNREYIKQSENLLHANFEIMSVLGSAIAQRDNETNAHNYRVTLYAIKFAEVLKLEKKELKGIIKGAFLHDVGKIGIRDNILLKNGKLTSEEFHTMKHHVAFGLEIISKSRWLDDAQDILLYHHERFDGTGYMQGLTGLDIPLNARIFMICDVFDALTSQRAYKEAFSLEKSIEMIKERSGTHFDPKLVPLFCQFIEDFYKDIDNVKSEKELQDRLNEKIHYLKL